MASESEKKNDNEEPRTGGGDQEPPGDNGRKPFRDVEADIDHKDYHIKYMTNGNKTKLMTSGLLNTAALSTNASLLSLIIKLEKMNSTASISLCLIIVSVTLQLMTAIITLCEYRATLIIDRDPEKLRCRSELKKSGGDRGETPECCYKTDEDIPFCFCKPMELQFWGALCTMVLTAVNTFTIAFTSNIREDLEIPASMLTRTANY